MPDDGSSIFDHLDDDESILPFAAFPLPDGGELIRFDVRDEEALERVREQMEAGLAEARAALDARLDAIRSLYLRATQPGFFEFVLDEHKANMTPLIRAEYIAEAALERRVRAIEGLISEKLMPLNVETTGG